MSADAKKELSGVEGLLVYMRYLEGTIPDFSIMKGRRNVEASSLAFPETALSDLTAGKEMALAEIAEVARACRLCALEAGRKNVVFGEGSPSASLMFVGEGPGADEDSTGRPFVGKAGELLTRMIVAMGYERSNVYIANIVKCRPPGNRVPEESERLACLPYLHQQISIVSPRVIILLGQTAALGLLRSTIGISKLRGRETKIPEFPGIRVMPTFHPAFLLRNPSAKADVWDDLKQVMAWLKDGHL